MTSPVNPGARPATTAGIPDMSEPKQTSEHQQHVVPAATSSDEIEAVRRAFPTLDYDGFAIIGRARREGAKTLLEAAAEVDQARAMLRHPANLGFFAGRRVGSYHLKHVAERRNGAYLGYVSGGAMIVAAVIEGFDVRPGGPGSSCAAIKFPGKARRRTRDASDWRRPAVAQ